MLDTLAKEVLNGFNMYEMRQDTGIAIKELMDAFACIDAELIVKNGGLIRANKYLELQVEAINKLFKKVEYDFFRALCFWESVYLDDQNNKWMQKRFIIEDVNVENCANRTMGRIFSFLDCHVETDGKEKEFHNKIVWDELPEIRFNADYYRSSHSRPFRCQAGIRISVAK
jgi:hypothetical protein